MQKSNLIITTMKAATYTYDAYTSAFLTHAFQSYGLWRKKQMYVQSQSWSFRTKLSFKCSQFFREMILRTFSNTFKEQLSFMFFSTYYNKEFNC